jgi:hypothetical protein
MSARAASLAQPGEHRVAIEARQIQVEHYEIRRVGERGAQTLAAIGLRAGAMSIARQRPHDMSCELSFIFDHEDSHVELNRLYALVAATLKDALREARLHAIVAKPVRFSPLVRRAASTAFFCMVDGSSSPPSCLSCHPSDLPSTSPPTRRYEPFLFRDFEPRSMRCRICCSRGFWLRRTMCHFGKRSANTRGVTHVDVSDFTPARADDVNALCARHRVALRRSVRSRRSQRRRHRYVEHLKKVIGAARLPGFLR